jgi:hypothetical protein
MSTVRVLFLARYRIPHALFSLQWDHYLEGIDYTVVASPVPQSELWSLFDRYHINTDKWQYINDEVVYRDYPEVNHWVFPGDYRTFWLRQQAIKLAFLDTIREDVMLMHDPDTFMIEPYRCVDNGVLNFMALENTTQGSYDSMFEAITGLPRQTPHCFVTELVPVKRQHIDSLKIFLQQRHGGRWLDALIEHCPGMPTVPPWGTGNVIKWFSEYEFLGNWALSQEDATFQWQRRYEYDRLDLLRDLDASRFNAVCDAVPDLSLSMQLDPEQGTVIGFDQYRGWVSDAIQR